MSTAPDTQEWLMVTYGRCFETNRERWYMIWCWSDGSQAIVSDRDTEDEAVSDAEEQAAKSGMRVVRVAKPALH